MDDDKIDAAKYWEAQASMWHENYKEAMAHEEEARRYKLALARYSCACSEPCALYDAEKAREADMPHMMCGWWAKSALEGK